LDTNKQTDKQTDKPNLYKHFENAQKIIMKSANYFVFVLYCTKRRCSEIKPQLKVEIEDGREAP